MKTNQGNPIEVGEGAGVGRVPLPHLPTPGTGRGLQPMGSRHPEPSFTPVNVCSEPPRSLLLPWSPRSRGHHGPHVCTCYSGTDPMAPQ